MFIRVHVYMYMCMFVCILSHIQGEMNTDMYTSDIYIYNFVNHAVFVHV